VTLPLAGAAEGKGLSKLWARRMITDAEIARTLRKITPADADNAILRLALQHQLVTRLTSLVAVDKTPSRPDGEPLKLAELPLNLPAGWEFAKVFGERQQPLPSPATPQLLPGERRADADPARIQVAEAKRALPVLAPAPTTVTLPKTATDAELKMIAGSILLALSLILLMFNRRRSFVR
jgi:Ca-activated chloride channel family protein